MMYTKLITSLICVMLGLQCPCRVAQAAEASPSRPSTPTKWLDVPSINFEGGLKAYWGVTDGTNGANSAQAYGRGFLPLTLINTYADYPGKQQESILPFVIGGSADNPWKKPDYFERIIRRNIALSADTGIFIHDLEFAFQEDLQQAWSVPDVRVASNANSFEEFENNYLKEWATWYTLPLKWAKEQRPNSLIGVYGPQPFRRDFWGIAGKTAQQIDGTHAVDNKLWNYIDPYVDFYISSIYIFYNLPASVFYMAANVEENFQRSRVYGDRPVHAYVWLRTHKSGDDVEPYLAEAMAIVPYFSGAKATMLFGFEPQHKSIIDTPFQRLPLFTSSLARVAALSEKIGRGKLVIDVPAHKLWNSTKPLVRKIETADNECVVMAVNPWQEETAVARAEVVCHGQKASLEMKGRHVTLVLISRNATVLY